MDRRHSIQTKAHSTFKVGGDAHSLVRVVDVKDIALAYRVARAEGLSVVPIGAGSNMLMPDGNLNAMLIQSADEHISFVVKKQTVHITVGAGVVWDDLVALAVSRGWWGIENLSGIPGTVGGAVVANIGAYGAVLSDVVDSVSVYDTVEQKAVTISRARADFGYRTSIFKKSHGRYFVMRATLVLSLHATPRIGYKDLDEHFKHVGSTTIAEIRNAVLSIRARKFPSLDAYGTAGSFFLNPVVERDVAELLQSRYALMPLFDLPEGGTKVPLAWILEHVVQVHGMRVGGAFVWPEHSLVIATDNTATSNDVKMLAQKIVQRVYDVVQIKISPEVHII
ncbi:MAG: hypothetical protein RLZZ283_7 [Candidatus Parcubacteria bacterium]|jgi:UDP-N-acetylmuramate dehydrogenase